MPRKICVVTGSRAEYGLLYWTMKGIQADPDFCLQLLVTGMHLSPEFGLTFRTIEADGFAIDRKVELLLSSDSATGIAKSMGLGMIGFPEAYDELKPDLVLLLGDRFEVFSAAAAAMVCRIPVAHCHGGEATEGLIDEPIRHSITKMSHLHFTSTETYRKRVIQLGEEPERVFNVGALGIENIHRISLMGKIELEESLGFALNGKVNIMVTFHPVTLEHASAQRQFGELLDALDALQGTRVVFTKANADTEGRIINQMIDDYVASREHCVAFASLGQARYLSLIQFVDLVVGNSSSGLIEAPSLGKVTVDVGDRQKGRIRATSVIHCQPTSEDISEAIARGLSLEFRSLAAQVVNPYGTGNASEKIIPILKGVDLSGILKKKFYDL